MEKNKILTVVLAIAFTTLLVFGLVMAVDAVRGMGRGRTGFLPKGGCMQWAGEKPMNNTSLMGELGLPGNATREQVQEAVWKKRLSELGLTEDNTIRECMEAVKARRQGMQEQRMQEITQKLGLPEDATEEQLREAIKGDTSGRPFMGNGNYTNHWPRMRRMGGCRFGG